MKFRLAILLVTLAFASALPTAQSSDRLDLDAVYKIKDEAFQRSAIMELMGYLTDIHGPRLTNSPNIKVAAAWTTAKMTDWGLVNVKQEPSGPFGRGWSIEKFYLHAMAPQKYPIIGFPEAWTPGTEGLRRGEVAVAVIASAADTETHRGKLKGKIVMSAALGSIAPSTQPLSSRYDDGGLERLSREPAPSPTGNRGGSPPGGTTSLQALNRLRAEFYASEGVLATLEPSRGVNGGTIFVVGPPRAAAAEQALWGRETRSLLRAFRKSSSLQSTTTASSGRLKRRFPWRSKWTSTTGFMTRISLLQHRRRDSRQRLDR